MNSPYNQPQHYPPQSQNNTVYMPPQNYNVPYVYHGGYSNSQAQPSQGWYMPPQYSQYSYVPYYNGH